MRNKDNYRNAYQYIIEQLFVYNYNNPAHIHILKLKLWILDADLMQSELLENGKTPDINVNAPMNHKESFMNELIFLDLYRRTKDKLLEKYEHSFTEVMSIRKNSMLNWCKQKDPLTGLKRHDYEMPYASRPSLLTERDFEKLYTAYKIKERAGELSSCLDIVQKITDDNIDVKKYLAEMSILNYVLPEKSEQQMFEQALKLKLAEDDDLVYEINSTKQKIIDECIRPLMLNMINISPVPVKLQNTYTMNIVIVNMPSNRENVLPIHFGPAENRKGFINEYIDPPAGGYRYPVNIDTTRVWKIANIDVNYTTTPGILDPDTGLTTPTTYTYNSYSIIPIFPFIVNDIFIHSSVGNTFTTDVTLVNNQVEKNWNYLNLALYYDAPIMSAPDINGLTTQIGTQTCLYVSPIEFNLTARFNSLNARWTNLNVFREHKLDDVGNRIQLETMFDTSIPYMLDKLKKQLQDLIDEKKHITYILQEDCFFSEFL